MSPAEIEGLRDFVTSAIVAGESNTKIAESLRAYAANACDLVAVIRSFAPHPGTHFVCPQCGSDDIQGEAWVRLNTGIIVGTHDDAPGGRFWCDVCDLAGRDGDVGTPREVK